MSGARWWNSFTCKRDNKSGRMLYFPEICTHLCSVLYFMQASTRRRTSCIIEVSLLDCLFMICTTARLSECASRHWFLRWGPQISIANTIGKSSLNVMGKWAIWAGQEPLNQFFPNMAPKPRAPAASVYKCIDCIVLQRFTEIRFFPLKCSTKSFHACKSRRLSPLRVILWAGLLTFLVLLIRRRKNSGLEVQHCSRNWDNQ